MALSAPPFHCGAPRAPLISILAAFDGFFAKVSWGRTPLLGFKSLSFILRIILLKNIIQNLTVAYFMAEREGFEPSVEC